MELAGKISQVYAIDGTTAMTSSTGTEVKCDDSTLSLMVDVLETTNFGDAAKRRMPGLKDADLPISGNYDPSDAGQAILKDNLGDYIYIGVYPQGDSVAGTQIKAFVSKFEIKASASGKQTFSCSLGVDAADDGGAIALPAQS